MYSGKETGRRNAGVAFMVNSETSRAVLGYNPVSERVITLRPCSHCQSCAGTVPICRISGVCERAMSAIKLDLISENLIRSREGSVFRHNYLCRNKCNVNADYTCVGERWRCQLDIINFVIVNDSQSIYL